MSAVEEGSSRCGRRTALSLFFLLQLIAYVLSCVALISPSWQYVYLENGRTEHHHGLWLDCKRDYSHDYGRTREYYETLYRLDKQQTPFHQFFLTSLLCVFKFDYYIDTEDLYDHNHDENRLQDDANQHLPLGWKIASLVALGFATLTAAAALLLSICAFCHRTLICAAAVLVTIAALLSSMGLLVFWIWANYQDNNIIKDEDGGIYEQYFGWALYVQIVGTVMHFIASFAGCIVTSMAFRKRGAKLVKIEVVDGDDSTLLDRTSSLPFKRSYSAVYKVDSAALRKWEKEYMNMVKSGSITERSNFKRATSVPNFKKYPKKSQYNPEQDKITRSTSNLFTSLDHCNFSTTSETFTSAAKPWPLPSSPTPKSILKASSKQLPTTSIANRRLSDDPDLTYEYLPSESMNKSQSTETMSKSFTTTAFADTDIYDQKENIVGQRTHPETSINVYDKVYEHISDVTKPTDYEQPNSYRVKKSTATSSEQLLTGGKDVIRSTLINDVPGKQQQQQQQLQFSSTKTIENLHTMSTYMPEVPITTGLPREWRSSTDRRQESTVPSKDAFKVAGHDVNSAFVITGAGVQPTSRTLNLRDFALQQEESSYFSSKPSSNGTSGNDVAINTFDVGTFATREGQRSIKNLAFRPNRNENIEAFERIDSSEQSSTLDEYQASRRRKPDPLLIKSTLTRKSDTPASCDIIIPAPYRMYLGDETDRSVGSSATLENEAVPGPSFNSQQQHEAELCLNLFMNGGMASLVAGSRSGSSSLTDAKENNITTV